MKYNGLQVRLWRLYGASDPLHASRPVSLWRLDTQATPSQRTQVSPVEGIHGTISRDPARRSCRFDRHNKQQVIVQWQCGEEIKVCARRPIVAPKCLPCVEGKSSLMFMFRSRKTNLTKRLVKARKRRGNETRRTVEEETESISTLLKKLQENQLEMLLRAIDTTGKDLRNCVLLPQSFGEEPHVLCCQTWRWPDLRQGSELRRMPMCRSACDPVYICCNPYHWSRLCQPGECPLIHCPRKCNIDSRHLESNLARYPYPALLLIQKNEAVCDTLAFYINIERIIAPKSYLSLVKRSTRTLFSASSMF